ncbi:hypothetical protein RDABS01_028980 [Bienertia sinuspersici]
MSLIILHLCFISQSYGSSDSKCSNDTSLAGFRSEFVMLQHQLRGVLTVLDNCSFRVSEFDMLPGSDHVHWWGAVGDNFVNLTNGFIISDEKLNRTYKNDSFVVHLRSNVSWDQISLVAVWDSPTASDFGHALLNNSVNGSELLAPAPAPGTDSSSNTTSAKKWRYEQPTMFENCKVLSSKYRVRWTLRDKEDAIDIGLEAVTGIQNYMAFGWANPNASSGYMLHSDVAVTGFTEEGMPFAEDYYITDYSECSVDEDHVARGVCPDSLYNGSDSVNNTHLVYGHRKDGVSFIRYQRPLKANDRKNDISVDQNENVTVIWALGRIKPPDSLRPYSLPQNHGGPQFETYGYLDLNVSEHINDCMGPLDAEFKEDQGLVIADANTPLVVTSGVALHYPNPPNPSKVLYINKKEAPVLRVERGVPVKFSVQAGHDVAFYLTSDPLGGNATERNVSETIYAGGAELEGVPASPKELLWTPHRNTPDLIYYQSAYQQKMGWKVQVVDGGLSDMYNNSVVLDDQQVNFFWTLSESSISVAARGEKKSGYLAIGFGSEMVHSFAYVGWFDDEGKGRVDTYWIDGTGPSDVHPTKENLTYVRCKSENGFITLEFTRPLNPSCPKKDEMPECSNIIDPTTPLKVIWAMGATWSNDHLTEKNMHSAHSSRHVRVMLNRGSAEVEQDLRPVLAVHGFMMFLAWGILLPVGVLTARYMKHVKGDGWYQIHVYLQYSGLSIVLLGFLFAVAELKGLFMTSIHVKLGLTAVILACSQPIIASVRPKKSSTGENPSSKRVIWEYSHVIIGRSAIIIGMASLFTGMKHLGERYGEDVRRLTWALICWFLIGGVTVVYLEYREKQHVSRSSSGRDKWVLGNDDDDSTDLLSPAGTYAEKEAHLSDRMEVQLEPLNR